MPSTVPVYYPNGTEWAKKDLAVTWNPVDESLLQTQGNFTLTGTIPGTDLQAQLKVRVREQTGRNAALNQNHNDQDSLAFASITNDTDPASKDKVHYVNDGSTNESNRWTNWSRQAPSKEVSVGVLFKKQGKIATETVTQVGMQFFRDGGTDAPQKLVLEYYAGPDFAEPNPASRYSEQTDHPFNDPNNWKQLNYTADSEIKAGKMIHFNFDAVKTKAIRARMTRKDTTNGIALVEFSAVTPTESLQSTTTTSITVNGQTLFDFAADKTDYRLEYQGARPRIEATATNNATVTVVQSESDELPSLVRVVTEDGQTIKEYRIQLVKKVADLSQPTPPVHKTTPDEGVPAPVVEQPRLDVVTEEVGFKTIERENPQLPKGTRKVVQEGKTGEKTTLVEVTIENGKEIGRVTRDSFVSKVPVDQIVEIGSKEEKPSTPPVPSKPESDLRILTDKATKVQVIGTKAILDKVVSLKVKKVKAQNLEGKTYDAYDITLEGQDGQPIQPKGKVFVSLPLAANKEVEAVYTVKSAQQVDSLVFQQKGRYVEFMTGQLSVYAVVYKTSASQVQEEKPEIPSQDQTNKPDSPQNQEAKPDAPLQTPERKETAVLPNTGTATDSAFLLGLLTALTGLFLIKKREE